jgi:predicted O-linked N-acetylglucosamine transferase (SPINDLY family)
MLASPHPTESVVAFFNANLARARAGEQTLAELFSTSAALAQARQPRLAVELYRNWIAFNASHDLCYMAYFNLAVLLRETNDLAGAIDALTISARLNKDFHQARINLGAFSRIAAMSRARSINGDRRSPICPA